MARNIDNQKVQTIKDRNTDATYFPIRNLQRQSEIMSLKAILPTKHGLNFVSWTDILYCKSDGNYIKLYIIESKEMFVNMTISCFERAVPEPWFVRIHHQYIINVQHLVRYEKGDGGCVRLIQDIILPVSRERKKMFLNIVIGGDHMKVLK